MSEDSESLSEKRQEATRLVIFLPPKKGISEATITVKAITDDGNIDTTRDDVIELSLNQESGTRFTDSSKTLRLTLVNGEVKANVLTKNFNEVVVINANWISGRTPLQSMKVMSPFGGPTH